MIQETHTESDSEFPEFQIIPAIELIAGDFVAISHSGAEGLRNPAANEVPNCSLKWISDTVDFIAKESQDFKIPFWIHNLCAPIEPCNLWMRAINRLRKPYTDATIVSVLGSNLYTEESTNLSPLGI